MSSFKAHQNCLVVAISSVLNKGLTLIKMYSIRPAFRALQGVPVPALVIFIIITIFLISQFSITSFTISYPSKLSFDGVSAEPSTSSNPADGKISLDEPREDGPEPPRWTYQCSDSNEYCTRREAKQDEELVSLDVCWLTCGSHGTLWPFPRFQKSGPETMKFLPGNIILSKISANSEGVTQLIKETFHLKLEFFEKFPGLTAKSASHFALPWPFAGTSNKDKYTNNVLEVTIGCNSTEEIFTLQTSEEYEISIEEIAKDKQAANGIYLSVFIYGNTFFGVRHGLETLSQLIALDASKECLQILKRYYANDRPKFSYRGILVDSARNFVPIHILRRVVDGMSFNKLNILHLHLSDSNSFTFYSKSVPQMTQYGALSEDHTYSPSEMAEFVKYARLRGVKVIPELDAPSHAGNGWQFGEKFGLGELSFYINKYDNWNIICGQPPCGILNPLNSNTYDILEKIYADMIDVFDKDLFHMGGDEVNLGSWYRQSELKTWIKERNMTGIDLWKFFQTQAFERLRKQSGNVTAILWTSGLTAKEGEKDYLNPKDYIIQVWEFYTSRQVQILLQKGFSLIISFVDKLYLDWGEGTWLGTEHNWKYTNWQVIYDTEILPKTLKNKKQILGGEAALWSEKVAPWQIEAKLWPRAAAFAENLWSYPKKRYDEVYSRLNYNNYRMQKRGILTAMVQPESCLHFSGHCINSKDVI